MKKSAYFTRISESAAQGIATQVAMGVLNETEALLANTEKQLASYIPSAQQRVQVLAEVETELKKHGVYASFKKQVRKSK